jgi:hypothetical protein
MKTSASPSLISGILTDRSRLTPGQAARRMEPIRRNWGDGHPAEGRNQAKRNRGSIQDRTMNVVVDRLLKELTW